jgi:hypothetical protein
MLLKNLDRIFNVYVICLAGLNRVFDRAQQGDYAKGKRNDDYG